MVCADVCSSFVLLTQNATSINPVVQLSAVQAARWGNASVNTQAVLLCDE